MPPWRLTYSTVVGTIATHSDNVAARRLKSNSSESHLITGAWLNMQRGWSANDSLHVLQGLHQLSLLVWSHASENCASQHELQCPRVNKWDNYSGIHARSFSHTDLLRNLLSPKTIFLFFKSFFQLTIKVFFFFRNVTIFKVTNGESVNLFHYGKKAQYILCRHI